MKRIALILLTLLFVNGLYSQNWRVKQAHKKFEIENYADAIERYNRIVERDSSDVKVVSQLADAYRLTNDFVSAEKWYALAVEMEEVEAGTLYYYAEVLKIQGKHRLALQWIERFNQKVGGDARAQKYIQYSNYANIMQSVPSLFEVKYLDMNTDASDFGVTFLGNNKVVFASDRTPDEGFFAPRNVRDKSSFLKLHSANVANWQIEEVEVFASELNSLVHDGPAVFSLDGAEIFFTRNYYKLPSQRRQRVNYLKIYSANFDDENWVNITSLPFNSSDYSCGHPALSPDGKKLYFVSDMPGGQGRTDIYVVERNEAGWGEPQNLGAEINTVGREMFPYIDKDGNLYFSSDGYVTFGGLDVFVAYAKGNGFSTPENLGLPLNSSADDFAFVLAPDGVNGYFSSNRRLSSSDDLYHFEILSPYVFDYMVVDSEDKKPISDVNVSFIDEKIIDLRTDAGGVINVESVKESTFNVLLKKNNYFSKNTSITTKSKSLVTPGSKKFIEMKPIYVFDYILVDRETKNPINDANVKFIGETIDGIRTNTEGAINKEFDKKNTYNILFQKDGYIAKTKSLATTNKRLVIPDSKEIIKMVSLREDIKFTLNIYFDLGSWDIRDDAAADLDEVALRFLQENPTVTVELSAHTDSRGNAQSNLRLSQQRAQAAVDYLISKGIDPHRLEARGYGTTRLLNHCSDGVQCSEEEHQINRRVEIRVISF